MASLMRSLLKSRKAQFYVLSAVAIIGILYFLSRWMEPSSITDTSSIALTDEPFIFDNIKEKAVETVQKSKSCDEMKYNLEEYKNFVEEYGLKNNLVVNLDYTYACPGNINFELSLMSTKMTIASNFTVSY
jgi:hypothetical protein